MKPGDDYEPYIPDPEIAEILADNSRGASVLDRLQAFSEDGRGRFVGSGFGLSHRPNVFTRLAPSRPDRRPAVRCSRLSLPDRKSRPAVVRAYRPPATVSPKLLRCLWCGDSFFRRSCRVSFYCTPACRVERMRQAGRLKILAARPCRTCHRPFLPDRAARIHCSRACYRPTGAARVIRDRDCGYCRLRFRPFYSAQTYCSQPCSDHAQRKPLHATGCPACGGPVTGRKNKVYCSRVCKHNAVNRRSRKGPTVTLDDAKNAILNGAMFGEVFGRLAESDHVALREWFCRTPGVPVPAAVADRLAAVREQSVQIPAAVSPSAARAVTSARASGYTGNSCSTCQGVRLVRKGACETCEDCGSTTGCG